MAELVDGARFGLLHWRVLLLCALVLMLDGYDLSAMGFALPAIANAVGIPTAAFGPALSASMVGVAIGSLAAGPLGDRYGRRFAIVGCFALVGIGALSTTSASSLHDFEMWRFFTGLGMGGVVPNAVALLSEYMPLRRRTFLVVAAFSTAALGSSGGSLIAALLVPRFGWQAVFLVGGIFPLLVTVVAVFGLPESVFFLTRKSRFLEAASLSRRMGFTLPAQGAAGVDVPQPAPVVAIGELFRGNLRSATCLIWVLFIGTQGLVFFMGGWLATLLAKEGLPVKHALVALSAFHMGSFIVGLLVAWQSDRRSPEGMLAATYVSAAISVALLAAGGIQEPGVYVLCFTAGGGVVGASFCLGALASSYYPPHVRAMGLGWGLGVGRIGSITSPLLGGMALAAGWRVSVVLAAAVVPAVICSLVVLALARTRRSLSIVHQTL
ncbi:MAG: MFS transporter [Betaproteobacteria bacterium]